LRKHNLEEALVLGGRDDSRIKHCDFNTKAAASRE
jgi:hypothetical protein